MYGPIPLQVSTLGFAIVGLLVLVLAIVTIWQMVRFVDAYDKQALTVFGEDRGLLEPGTNFVPPFVSRSYTFDRGGRRDATGGEDWTPAPAEFVGPEERVGRLLRDHGGRMPQQAIIEQTGWSPSKASRELCSMERRDAIVRAPLGREKIVCLPEATPDAVRAR